MILMVVDWIKGGMFWLWGFKLVDVVSRWFLLNIWLKVMKCVC